MAVIFPDPNLAPCNGPMAAGGDLSPETLLTAYRQGIFPWYDRPGGPILWWSPDPRMVLFPDKFHASRRLQRRIRQGRMHCSENQAFRRVMQGCAGPRKREQGTWIHPEMINAYGLLHELGHAHSIEVWNGDELAGGLYGLHLGRAFFAESMFSRCRDASKIALARLVEIARRQGWLFIDCQLYTDHLASLGAREIARREYLHLLRQALT